MSALRINRKRGFTLIEPIDRLRARCRRTQAFTLIEILAAMAVLSLIVLILGSLFDQTTKAWTSSEGRVVSADLGRSVLDEVYRDVMGSVADDILPFAVNRNYAVVDGSAIDAFAGEKIGRSDTLRLVGAVAPRSTGTEDNDLLDVTYWMATRTNKLGVVSGVLRRRASNILFPPEPSNGLVDYVSGGPLDMYVKLFDRPFFISPDEDTEVVVDNVYSFEVTAYDENLNEIGDYYSKNHGDMQPARLDIRLVLLSDAQWARQDTMSDWPDWVKTHGEVFVVSAALPMRGR